MNNINPLANTVNNFSSWWLLSINLLWHFLNSLKRPQSSHLILPKIFSVFEIWLLEFLWITCSCAQNVSEILHFYKPCCLASSINLFFVSLYRGCDQIWKTLSHILKSWGPHKKKGESLDDLSHWKLKLTLVCPTQSLSFSFFPFCLKDSLTAISVEKPSQELHFLAFKTQQHWYKLKDHLMEFTDCTFDTTHLCREASIWTWTASCSSRAFSLPDLCRSSPSTWIPPLHPHAPPTLPNF